MPETTLKAPRKNKSPVFNYLREVDLDNIQKQKCKLIDELLISRIDVNSFELEDQEYHFFINFELVDKTLIEQKIVECSIPSYMYKLFKNPKFTLRRVLTSVKWTKRILQIEGIFDKEMKVI